METLIAPFINLLILLGLMAYYLRQPLKEFAQGRAVTIRQDLKTVGEQLEQANQKHAEFSSKLKAMDAEIVGLKNQAIQEGQGMKARIAAEAQKQAANIVTDARNAAVVLYSEFKSQMYMELGNRVLDRAEQIIRERLTDADRARISQEFTSQVGVGR
jgi:F-type H+-transporting ATPase subunit b